MSSIHLYVICETYRTAVSHGAAQPPARITCSGCCWLYVPCFMKRTSKQNRNTFNSATQRAVLHVSLWHDTPLVPSPIQCTSPKHTLRTFPHASQSPLPFYARFWPLQPLTAQHHVIPPSRYTDSLAAPPKVFTLKSSRVFGYASNCRTRPHSVDAILYLSPPANQHLYTYIAIVT